MKRRSIFLDSLRRKVKIHWGGIFVLAFFSVIILKPCLAQESNKTASGDAKGAERGKIDAEVKPPAKEEDLFSLNFEQADMGAILKVYSELKNVTVIRGERVAGKVTVISPIKLPRQDAIRIIEAVLEMKGLTIIKMDSIVKVILQKEAVRKAIETRVDEEVLGTEDIMVTQIIPLKFVEADTIVKNLRALVSGNGTIFSNEQTNSIVIIDTASNIKRLIDIITELDVEIFKGKVQIEVIQLMHADVEELAEILKQIFTAETARQRVPTRVTRRATRVPEAAIRKEGLEELLGKVKIIPYVRLQSLVVITTVEYFSIVYELVEQMDVEGPALEEATRVYYLQNAEAKELVVILRELFTGITKEEERPIRRRRVTEEEEVKRAGLTGEINLVADERTNSLLITTAPQNFSTIENLIAKLDIRTAEVLIEVLIAEITLTDAMKFGVELEAIARQGDVVSTAQADWGLVGDWDERTIASGSAATTGFKYWLMDYGQNLSAFLWTIASESEINILSTPRILCSNNKEAKIIVGEEVPVVKESRILTTDPGAPQYKTFEYKDVAIELTVTPRISQNRDVALDVHQVVKKLGTYNEDLEAYSFVKREAKTSVVVADRQTLVIGGLIKDDRSESIVKVPFFGDIPIIGRLFKKKTTTIDKTELLLFITPYVILTEEEADTMSKEQESKVEIEGTPSREKAKEHYEQGLQHYKDGRYPEALAELKSALSLDPSYARGKEYRQYMEKTIIEVKRKYYSDGLILYHHGEYAQAIAEWEKVLSLDPGHRAAARCIVKAQRKLEKQPERMERKAKKDEIERNRKEEKLRRDQIEKHYLDGKTLYRQGKYAEAIAEWEELLSLDPTHKAAARDIERARDKLELMSKEEEEEEEAEKHYQRGIQYYEDGSYTQAIAEWEKVPNSVARHKAAARYIERARDKLELMRKEEAKEEAEKHYQWGIQYYEDGTYIEAIAEWEKVLSLDPTHKAAARGIEQARDKLEMRKEKEAKEEAEKHYQRGIQYYEDGNYTEAVAEWEQTLLLDPSSYRKIDRYKRLMEKAFVECKEKHYSQGVALYKEAKYAEAIAEWEKVPSSVPRYNAAARAIERARKDLDKARGTEESGEKGDS